MPQTKSSKISNFFSWARRGKPPVSVEVARRDSPEASNQVTLQQLKQGYGEVVDTMKSVRAHLDQQADRSEQMLMLMKDLPEVLRSIPEGTKTQTRMLEAIHANLERQNETSSHLTSAITGLAAAAASQEKALTSINDHMAEEKDTRDRLNDGVSTLNDTLGHVMDSNSATRESMGAVVEQTRVNDERMREMYQRSQKMNTAMVLLCLALATGALALGGYMAMLVTKMTSTTPAQPAAVVPTEPAASSAPPTTPAEPAPPAPAADAPAAEPQGSAAASSAESAAPTTDTAAAATETAPEPAVLEPAAGQTQPENEAVDETSSPETEASQTPAGSAE